MSHVIIIGGGAAGMMAAIAAAGAGHKVCIYEKNEKLGKKIYITGKGRCNVTNACDTEELFRNVVHNAKFLYSSFYTFTNTDVMDLIEKHGCPLKTERGGRVFPVSDKSSDVIHALTVALRELGVEVELHEEVSGVLAEDGHVSGVRLKRGLKVVPADAVIVTTGGLSYPSTGSTGDGYRFATELDIPLPSFPRPWCPLRQRKQSVRICRACPCATSAYRSGKERRYCMRSLARCSSPISESAGRYFFLPAAMLPPR